MTTYAEYRKILITQIAIARREYFRIKSEIAALEVYLPCGSYIEQYKSNHNWWYHSIGHKDAVLPSFKNPDRKVKKLHLGNTQNPRYLEGLIEIEKLRCKQIKEETLIGVINHLEMLKSLWRELRRCLRDHHLHESMEKREDKPFDFIEAAKQESIIEFIKRQQFEQNLGSDARVQSVIPK